MFQENLEVADRLVDVVSSALVTLFIEGVISGTLQGQAMWLALAGVGGLIMILFRPIQR